MQLIYDRCRRRSQGKCDEVATPQGHPRCKMRLENTWTKRETMVPGPYVQSKIVYMTSTSGIAMAAKWTKPQRKRLVSKTKAMEGDDESRQEHDVKQYHFCRHSVSHKS